MRRKSVPSIVGYACRSAAAAALAVLAVQASPGLAEDGVTAGTTTGTVWWSEIMSADPARTRAFYTNVAGWTAKAVAATDPTRPPKPGEAEYTIFMRNGVEVAGASKIDADDARPGWLTYIEVANVDDAVIEVLKNGGRILKAPFDDAGTGRMAVVMDPDGIPVGLVTPKASAPVN